LISWRKIFLWVGGSFGALFAALAVLLVVGLYTPLGHRTIAALVRPLTGGNVAVYGLSGSLSNHLRITRLELSDERGTWLRLDDLILDWNAFAIVKNHIEAARAVASHGILLRQPISSGKASAITLKIGDLSLRRLDVKTIDAGRSAALTIAGSLDYRSSNEVQLKIVATRIDDFGRYRIDGRISNGLASGFIEIAEANSGLVGDLLGLPGLGSVNLDARAMITGTRNSLSLRASMGQLHTVAAGGIDIGARTGDLAFTMDSQALRPRQDIGWQSLSAKGWIRGPFAAPDVNATLHVQNSFAFGFGARALALELIGGGGTARLTGSIEQLTVPGSQPSLFAANPLRVSADANLSTKSRPIRFQLDHPIFEMQGTATTTGMTAANATVHLPSLSPYASGLDINGSATFRAQINETQPGYFLAQLHGDIAARGTGLPARLLGPNAAVTLRASMVGPVLQSASGDLRGQSLSVRFQGSGSSRPNYDWNLVVPDLSRITSVLTGSLQLGGNLTGILGDLRAVANGTADMGTKTLTKQRIAIEATATGLPNIKSGDIRASGRFAGGPIVLASTISPGASGTRIFIRHGTWKSAQLSGDVILANSASAKGVLTLHMSNLTDLAPLLGQISGTLDANATVTSIGSAIEVVPQVTLRALRYESVAANRINLSGKVVGLSRPVSDLKAVASGLSLGNVGGDAELTLNGPLNNLAVQTSSKLSADGNPIAIEANGDANAETRQITLQKFNASWQQVAFILMTPTRFDLTNGVALSTLRAKIGTGMLTVAGSLYPKLSLAASATGVTPKMVEPLLPLALDGTFSASTTLSGTLAAPMGDIAIHGRDIRIRQGPLGASANSLEAHGTLQGDLIAVNASLSGDKAIQLVANGRIPLTLTNPIALAAKGNADLALLAAPLAATGQSLRGTVTIDIRVGGTWALPQASGSMEVANGEFQDFTRGIRLRNLDGRLEAEGRGIRIVNLSANAGNGTLMASGTIDFATPGVPVNITIDAKNARPITSDLLDATLQTDLTLTGKLRQRLTLDGEVKVLNANINVPEKFPASVAEIEIRRGGQQAPALPFPKNVIALNLTVSSTGQLFVRGRGVDAEFSGSLKIRGTSAAPQVLGALDMRRGTFSLAGTTLNFQSGKISFDGASLRNRLDPTLDFVAQTTSNGVTATLNLSGYASAPKVQLTSTPNLPQDEIMARLLFQQSATQLSALQIAEIADAITSLSGAGSGLNPVGSLRKSLGLDRLAVGSASSANGGSSQATIEAGKYISRNIYVGTTQNVSGGTRAIVQVDITKHLKAQAAVSMNAHPTNTTPLTQAQDTGDSVGLMYQFEY